MNQFFPNGLPEDLEQAYYSVLDVTNQVLRKCKLFSIEMLRDETPTIDEIAKSLRLVCNILEKLVELEPCQDVLIPGKAHEYVDHVQALAKAIEQGDEAGLNREVVALNKRSFT